MIIIQGLSQLRAVVSIVGKDRISRQFYQKIAQYCDILQRFCILRRFGGTRTPKTCVDSYKCGKANPGWLTL